MAETKIPKCLWLNGTEVRGYPTYLKTKKSKHALPIAPFRGNP